MTKKKYGYHAHEGTDKDQKATTLTHRHSLARYENHIHVVSIDGNEIQVSGARRWEPQALTRKYN
jgi:hypothetical protein